MRLFTLLMVFTMCASVLGSRAEASWLDRRKPSERATIRVKRKSTPRVAVPITALDVTGNHNVSRDVVLLSLATKPVDRYTEERLQRDMESLRSLGYISSVEADLAPRDGGVRITLRVVAEPTRRCPTGAGPWRR